MSSTLNLRALSFIRRTLFLADRDYGREVASLAVSQLASEFCQHRDCEFHNGQRGCRKHCHATMIAVAKMIVAGEVNAEISHRGVVFVRLTPAGVLEPESWTTVPAWFYSKPDLVNWARTSEERRRWEAKV